MVIRTRHLTVPVCSHSAQPRRVIEYMALAQEVQDAGREIAAANATDLPGLLNSAIQRFLGWPFKTASARVVDRDGTQTEDFASVVYAASEGGAAPDPKAIPADLAAIVIDATESQDLENFGAAYAHIAKAKSLKKTPGPQLKGTPSTTVTLGIIFAQRTALPLEVFAEELERLNAQTPSRMWPDMVVVASIGVINYAVQFPTESLSGDFLPPAEGALAKFTPPCYIVIVMKPLGVHTFNKMTAFLIAHLAIFSPGAKLPNWSHILDGTSARSVTISGYQYNVKGDLLPVPRQFYNDRYFPPPPLRIESRKGELLSTIQFLPWQDGGVVVLKGKLPLEGLMIFLGKEGLDRGGVVRRPPDVQISYVVPITLANFNEMLNRIQQQSNMVVRSGKGKWVIQKIADEGSTSPFIARLSMGIMLLRDVVYSDPVKRNEFDKPYEIVIGSLMNARTTAKEIAELWAEHARKVAAGEIAQIQGPTLHIDESIDKDLRKQAENFLNAAVRALKQGMQDLGNALQVNIGFMFTKQRAFEAGIAALHSTDPLLADYLRQTRTWAEPLLESRNAIEHKGWTLPRVTYIQTNNSVTAGEPQISSQPVTEFVKIMLDRLCCFVEEFTAHCLQRQMPAEITIAEIPPVTRLAEAPVRFTLTLGAGGLARWNIAYHTSSFEEI